MMKSYSNIALPFFLVALFFSDLKLNAQTLSSKQIDSVAEQTLRTFDVPGVAVAVIKDGKTLPLWFMDEAKRSTRQPSASELSILRARNGH